MDQKNKIQFYNQIRILVILMAHIDIHTHYTIKHVQVPESLNCVSDIIFFINLLAAESKLPEHKHTPSKNKISLDYLKMCNIHI